MSEVYLEVHAGALRERASAVRGCGSELAVRAEAIGSRVPAATVGVWLGPVVGPSAALSGGIEEVASALGGGMRSLHHEIDVIARAMVLAAGRYSRSDVLARDQR